MKKLLSILLALSMLLSSFAMTVSAVSEIAVSAIGQTAEKEEKEETVEVPPVMLGDEITVTEFIRQYAYVAGICKLFFHDLYRMGLYRTYRIRL